jgi:hypothetical protein
MTSVAEVADHYGAYEALKRQKRLVVMIAASRQAYWQSQWDSALDSMR